MSEDHWTETLFLRHPEVFLAVHENAWSTGEAQAKDLQRILERFGVPASGRILDAPCGIGRHGTRLAKMGYHVVGVRLSPTFVERAKELADRGDVAARATSRVGDLRRLSERGPRSVGAFDAAVNLWTSLGYYNEETDVRILQEYVKLVRPGGILIVYLVNRDYVVRHFDPQGYESFGDIVHIEQRHLDLPTSRMQNEWRFFPPDGGGMDPSFPPHTQHCHYSPHVFQQPIHLVRVAGLWESGGV